MLPPKRKRSLHQHSLLCYICTKKFTQKLAKGKSYCKVRGHWYFTGKYRCDVRSICSLRFNVPSEIPVVLHSDSNYDYYFIMKELANEFKSQFECLGKIQKSKNLFLFQKKKKVENLIKMVMRIL